MFGVTLRLQGAGAEYTTERSISVRPEVPRIGSNRLSEAADDGRRPLKGRRQHGGNAPKGALQRHANQSSTSPCQPKLLQSQPKLLHHQPKLLQHQPTRNNKQWAQRRKCKATMDFRKLLTTNFCKPCWRQEDVNEEARADDNLESFQ